MSDEVVGRGLDKAQMMSGDYRLTPNARQRWGNMVTLASAPSQTATPQQRKSATFVSTPVFHENRQWLLELRVRQPTTGLWLPYVPLSVPAMRLRIKLGRAIDRDKGVFFEEWTLAANEPWSPVVNGLQLNLTAELLDDGAGGGDVSTEVEICATPTHCCDSGDVAPNAGEGYATVFRTSYPNPGLELPLFATLGANALRSQFFLQNKSVRDLYIGFGLGVSTTYATILLPGRVNAIYESPANGECFKGPITFGWDGTDVDGYMFLTEGSFT